MSGKLSSVLADLDEEGVLALVQAELSRGENPLTILQRCREGMQTVGDRFQKGEYFISDLMLAGEIFKEVAEIVSPKLAAEGAASKGKVVMGTVQGDIHNIGKDIVITLLKSSGYEVLDLGVDVPPQAFVEAVQSSGAAVVGMSGLLTVAFDPMKDTVAALAAAGLRPEVKVMIGGGMVNDSVREYTGADAFGIDAMAAVNLCDKWTEAKK